MCDNQPDDDDDAPVTTELQGGPIKLRQGIVRSGASSEAPGGPVAREGSNTISEWCRVYGAIATPRSSYMNAVVDEHTRQCLAMKVGRQLRPDDVLQCLTELFIAHGVPAHRCPDNGPEFTNGAECNWLTGWAHARSTSSRTAPGRTATLRASMASCVTRF